MKQAHIEEYQDASGEWRWRLQDANGEITAVSPDGYSRKRDLPRAIDNVLLDMALILRQRMQRPKVKKAKKAG